MMLYVALTIVGLDFAIFFAVPPTLFALPIIISVEEFWTKPLERALEPAEGEAPPLRPAS